MQEVSFSVVVSHTHRPTSPEVNLWKDLPLFPTELLKNNLSKLSEIDQNLKNPSRKTPFASLVASSDSFYLIWKTPSSSKTR